MTQDEIIEMAKQAGYKHPDAVGRCEDFAYFNLEAFAKLVAEKAHEEFGLSAVGILERTVARAVAKEREACAKECEHTALRMGSEWMAHHCAAAIRARGEE
jgi:hypothetical protein